MFGGGSVIVNWECVIMQKQTPLPTGQKDNINRAEYNKIIQIKQND